MNDEDVTKTDRPVAPSEPSVEPVPPVDAAPPKICGAFLSPLTEVCRRTPGPSGHPDGKHWGKYARWSVDPEGDAKAIEANQIEIMTRAASSAAARDLE